MAKSTAKKPAKKQPAKKKEPTWNELNKSYAMLEVLTGFLGDISFHRKSPKLSKTLIKQITQQWATSLAKDNKQKHKAALIKSFGEYISSV